MNRTRNNRYTFARFTGVIAFLATLAVLVTGCASVPVLDQLVATQPVREPATLPSSEEPVRGTDLFPLHKLTMEYNITQGDKTDLDVASSLIPDGAASWKLLIGDRRVIYLQQNGDGAILVPREEEAADKAAVNYSPALQMLPAKLVPDHPQEFDCLLVVTNLKDGSVRDKGDCHYSVEYLGRQRVQTPAGSFDAYIVRSVRQLNLNLASVKVTILSAYVPSRGCVIQKVEQVRRLLGIFASKETEESKLAH